MKLFITLISFFIIFSFFAQNVVVADKNTHRYLPFALIKYNKAGFYTDEKGTFDLNLIPQKQFTVTYLGYKEKQMKKNEVTDTIFLEKLNYTLPEIIINTKVDSIYLTPVKKGHFYFGLQQKKEIIGYLVPESEYTNAIIKEISFIRKNQPVFYKDKDDDCLWNEKHVAYVRINVYKKNDNHLYISIFSSPPIQITRKQKIIRYEFNDSNGIIWSSSGLYFGLEYITCLNDDKMQIKKPLFVTLSKKHNKHFFQNTYYKYNELPDSVNIIPFNKPPFPKEFREQNIIIGLKIIKE